MKADTIRIKKLTNVAEFHACEQLQRDAWGSNDVDVVPLHVLITFQRNGGLVLGAFDDRGQMIGCLLGFLGSRAGDAGHPKHCSHMVGVLAEFRGYGVGRRLKLAQREHVLSQRLDLVTWTYDPLESLNAALNIRRLGGVCCTYIPNLYGSMDDELNADLQTDRFQIDWWVASRHVAQRLDATVPPRSFDDVLQSSGRIVNPAVVGTDGYVRACEHEAAVDGETILIEIPADIRGIKAADLDAARCWREQTGRLFQEAFAAGYLVTDFFSQPQPASETCSDMIRRSYYMLQRDFEVI